MDLVNRAVAAINEAKDWRSRLPETANPPPVTIAGDPAACLRLKEAQGSRALWTNPKASDPRQIAGRFAGVEVNAIPGKDVVERSLLYVLVGARVVGTIDFLPTMSPGLFYAACKLIWGDAWRSAVFLVLDVPERTLRRFLDGKSPIPPGIAREILEAVSRRQAELADLAERIRGRA